MIGALDQPHHGIGRRLAIETAITDLGDQQRTVVQRGVGIGVLEARRELGDRSRCVDRPQPTGVRNHDTARL